jgi:PEP-CTERM/exosortase A-associated glycosyltransferase
METYVVKRAHAVTTICEGLRSDLINRGFDNNKLTVIANAVNIEQFELITGQDKTNNNDLIESLKLQHCDVLGFLGSFYAYEGLDLVIDAMPAILESNSKARLLLVGGGPQDSALKAQVKALGLQEKVIFTGRVPHADVGKYYSIVDLLVYPRKSMRLTHLVTPLKPLEAMAQGKAVIASDVGGHKELISDNVTGFLFSAGDSQELAKRLIELLADKDKLNSVTSAGRAYVENVRNWQNSVRNYLPIYNALIDV